MNSIEIVGLLIVVVIVGGYFLVSSRQRQSGGNEDKWWRLLGWQESPRSHPIEFPQWRRWGEKPPQWTWLRQCGDTYGAISFQGPKSVDKGSASRQEALILANPYHGPDLHAFMSIGDAHPDAAVADDREDGDPAVMDNASWARLRAFLQRNPVPDKDGLHYTPHWLYLSDRSGFVTGPRAAIAYLDYLYDMTQAMQGRPVSGTHHPTAIRQAELVDKQNPVWKKPSATASPAR